MVHDSSLANPAEASAVDGVEGGLVDVDGEQFYRIANYDRMDPFFMSVVSNSDHWMFLSSNGGLTAGRRDPDNALFPYYTDDRIHDSAETTGSLTLIRVSVNGQERLWEPFSSRQVGMFRVERSMYKSVYGNQVVFEEINHDLGLSFRYSWANSDRFGFVRRSALTNLGESAVDVHLVDGIRNVLPSGISRRFQLEFSTLVDGYKRTETAQGTHVALFRLSSIPVDTAEPSEALRVNVAWSAGLDNPTVLLSTLQCDAFRQGHNVTAESDIRGRRGAYLVSSSLALGAGERREWTVVAEVELDASAVRALIAQVSEPDIEQQVLADVRRGTDALIRVVGSSDGLQATADVASVWRHFANTLFNVMRGGIPDDGYWVAREDLMAYLTKTNAPVAKRHAEFVASLPERVLRADLMAAIAQAGDEDLERLAAEYLPLSFSRRHGDPSRPWNSFAIRVKDEHGNPMLNYQGNWRDIFQNWEALALSYPSFVEAMLFKFADSSTLDGYNPYRVLREGYEWEIVDPNDEWSHIGYWGDHQVIYLLRLLEVAERHHPGSLVPLLTRKSFTFADVPYRIKSYEELLRDPRETIDFDEGVNEAALARAAAIGSDGLAVLGPDGQMLKANLSEKLLIVALAKLSNFIPEGGIWMNTQRPEWNDANNALVGNGISMVTLCYLRRYLAFVDNLFASAGVDKVEVSEAVAEFLGSVAAALTKHEGQLMGSVGDGDRKALLDELGGAGENYRMRVYQERARGGATALEVSAIRDFCAIAIKHADHSIAANRRADGLFHSYNIMEVGPNGIGVSHLAEMLEGQVAVLSAGLLTPTDAADLLDSLRASALYRADQNSYTLYPDKELPHFLDKNVVPAADVEKSALLTAMLKDGDRRLVSRDVSGDVHFDAAFRNSGFLAEALDRLADSQYAELAAQERSHVLAVYEDVFKHASFTGRSGTFYKYEGLGSIYWHMVSKLLLAVDEALLAAIVADPNAEVVQRLTDHYGQVRAGIGVDKSPAEYGAVPTDPYSHTPGFSGVQQPGMTGQVKEDVITRMSEMGVLVDHGGIRFEPARVRASELLDVPVGFSFIDLAGDVSSIALEPGTMAFTLCQVPVVLHGAGPRAVSVLRDGESVSTAALELSAEDSAAIFARNGEISRIDVFLGLDNEPQRVQRPDHR